jgi:hypothetical protein
MTSGRLTLCRFLSLFLFLSLLLQPTGADGHHLEPRAQAQDSENLGCSSARRDSPAVTAQSEQTFKPTPMSRASGNLHCTVPYL